MGPHQIVAPIVEEMPAAPWREPLDPQNLRLAEEAARRRQEWETER